MKKSIKRLKEGFTLAETLIAILILLMVSGLMAQGIPMAFNAYKKVSLAANANVLLSTTITELRDRLAYSKEIEVTNKDVYFTSNNGREYKLSYSSEKGGLYVEDVTPNDTHKDSRLLVSNEAAAKELYVTYNEAVLESNDYITFKGIEVHKKGSTAESDGFANIESYSIKLLNLSEWLWRILKIDW